MDTQLRWYERFAVRLHLCYCVWCRRYAGQVRFLRRASRQLVEDERSSPEPVLSTDAKTQMRERLQEALKQTPPPG